MEQIKLTKLQLETLARPLVDKVIEFYNNPENERRFREWYEATHGTPVPDGV